jgi:hypothetical protein
VDTYFLTSDLAAALRQAGSTVRTEAAVRAAVRTGRITPSGRTPSGAAIWTVDGAAEVLRLDALHRHDLARHFRRTYQRDPVQVPLTWWH